MAFRFYTATAFVILAASTGLARELSDDEIVIVSEKLDEMDAALESKNIEVLVGSMPQKVYDKIAEQAGIPAEELKTVMEKQTEAVMEKIEISDTAYSLEGFDLIEGGTVDYGYVTLDFKYSMQNIVQNLNAPVMVLHDKDEEIWSVLRVDEGQWPLLQEVYTDLRESEFPKAVPEGGAGQ